MILGKERLQMDSLSWERGTHKLPGHTPERVTVPFVEPPAAELVRIEEAAATEEADNAAETSWRYVSPQPHKHSRDTTEEPDKGNHLQRHHKGGGRPPDPSARSQVTGDQRTR
ncbi:hypothetical protein MRX96_012771 [Rhipicephalus microplus]